MLYRSRRVDDEKDGEQRQGESYTLSISDEDVGPGSVTHGLPLPGR